MTDTQTNTNRFEGRATDYAHRPSYPKALIRFLGERWSIDGRSVVADIGAGTGKFTVCLLELGCPVIAVEPSADMLREAKGALGDRVKLFLGPAENTGLEPASIDLITCAQAFHWFDYEPTEREFLRIAKPQAGYAVVWNQRQTEDPFSDAYDRLLRAMCPDYSVSPHRSPLAGRTKVFGSAPEVVSFAHEQQHDLAGLVSRCLSASYVPVAKTDAIREALADLFEKYQQDGRISFRYMAFVATGAVRSA